MENGDRLIRLLSQLQNAQPGSDQSLAIWGLAIGVRELATGTMLLVGTLSALVEDNKLTLTPELANEMNKISNVSKALQGSADALVQQYQPPEADQA
jgi:hypothetical protein